MRVIYLKLIATGLLTVCALLIIRQSSFHEPGSNKPVVSPSAAFAPRGGDRLDTPDTSPQPAGLAGKSTQHEVTPSAQPSTDASTSIAVPISDKPAFGVRLADNVRLPAVILALSDSARDPNHKVPAPVAAAMQSIVDTFYQDLAASVRDGAIAGKTTAAESADGAATAPGSEDTVVIQPGPAVDQARARANETYRTLFGDEAYNRLTMNTALEVKPALESASTSH